MIAIIPIEPEAESVKAHDIVKTVAEFCGVTSSFRGRPRVCSDLSS